MTKQRLAKYLAAAGMGSRRGCETLVFDGRVKIDGEVVLLPQTLVDGSEYITVDESPVKKTEEKVYYILNKPRGYVCSADPESQKKRVIDLFKKEKKRVFTVGRLDRDTTGLLIVTNDGHFAQEVIHPRANIQKEYIAKTSNEINDNHLKIISKGLVVEGTFVKPVKVAKMRRGTIKVIVKEGKKREVRRMLKVAGLDVRELKRVRIGGLRLQDLPVGQWRPLTKREREIIFT